MEIPDIVEVMNGESATITLNAANADIVVGGSGAPGDVKVRNGAGVDLIRITAGSIIILDDDGEVMCRIGQQLQLIPQPSPNPPVTRRLGYQIQLNNAEGKRRVAVRSSDSDILLGGNGKGGDIWLFASSADNDSTDNATVHIEGNQAVLRLGGNERDGDILLFPGGGNIKDDATASIHLDGTTANLEMGGNGADGDILLYPNNGNRADYNTATISLNAGAARILVGGNEVNGDLVLYPSGGVRADDSTATISLAAAQANVRIGGNGTDGDIRLYPRTGNPGDDTTATIHLNGDAGDIILQNADCAEEFEIAASESMEPGTVMRLNEDGKLQPSCRPYDPNVAGVVSGGGDCRPGIVLGRNKDRLNRIPIALVGKTFCKVDAGYAPIQVGDLLTSSATAGHAMKAVEREKAFGAVIGKALRPLASGTGTIPILIALQ